MIYLVMVDTFVCAVIVAVAGFLVMRRIRVEINRTIFQRKPYGVYVVWLCTWRGYIRMAKTLFHIHWIDPKCLEDKPYGKKAPGFLDAVLESVKGSLQSYAR